MIRFPRWAISLAGPISHNGPTFHNWPIFHDAQILSHRTVCWAQTGTPAHMIARANGGFWMSGCAVEWITLGDAWLSKAQTAHYRALKACEYEYDNYEVLAGSEWQKIFGTMISLTV
jgi:hypothetical protein